MPTFLTTTIDATVTAEHTYGTSGKVILGGGTLEDSTTSVAISSLSNSTSLGTSATTLVTENAIKTYVLSV